MTEIHAPRKRPRTWLWVLGAALILLAILSVRIGRQQGQVVGGDVIPNVDIERPRAAFDRFMTFVRDEPPDFGEMNAAHEYTRNGLQYLAAAIDEIIVIDGRDRPNVHTSLAALRSTIDALRADASAAQHAAAAKAAFDQAVTSMSELQRSHFPDADDEIAELRRAAQRVMPDRPLLNQRAAVKEFFDEAVTAIQAMGARPPTNSGDDR